MKTAMKKGSPSYGVPPTAKKKDTQCNTCFNYFRGTKGLFFHRLAVHSGENTAHSPSPRAGSDADGGGDNEDGVAAVPSPLEGSDADGGADNEDGFALMPSPMSDSDDDADGGADS